MHAKSLIVQIDGQGCEQTDQQFNACEKHIGLVVVLRIQVTLVIFQPYRDLEAGDNQSLKTKWRGQVFTPGHLAPQAKKLTTRPPLLPITYWGLKMEFTLLRYQHTGLSLRRWFLIEDGIFPSSDVCSPAVTVNFL